jgi:hypothetical protein
MQLKTDQPSYGQDFALWLNQTAARLKARDVDNLDWENLIEEIEALGILQKHEVESRLKTILSHILKRCYVPLPDCFRGWQVTIRTQRSKASAEKSTKPCQSSDSRI